MNQVTLAKDVSSLIQEWRLYKKKLVRLFGVQEASNEVLITIISTASVEKAEYLHRLLAIRDLIHILFPKTHYSDCLRRPNCYFDNRPLIKIIAGEPLKGSKEVHTYLMDSVFGRYL